MNMISEVARLSAEVSRNVSDLDYKFRLIMVKPQREIKFRKLLGLFD